MQLELRMAFMLIAMMSLHEGQAAGLEGRWIVAELGRDGHPETAQLPYEVAFTHPELDGQSLRDYVSVDIDALGSQHCSFRLERSLLVGRKNDASTHYQTLCTSTMTGGGGTDGCLETADPVACNDKLRADDEFLEDFFLRGESLTWRRSREKLVIHALDGDAFVVLVPNPLH